MTARISPRRRWPTAVIVAVSALVIGAIFGVPGIGQAASKATPANTVLPTISGTATGRLDAHVRHGHLEQLADQLHLRVEPL